MSNNILFIFEGRRTENQIVSNLQTFFVNEKTIIKCVYGAEIYQIYQQLVEDEDLDTFNLIKQRDKESKAILDNHNRIDFAELYMFFDYDGHSSLADDENLKILLEFFNEETDKGKLYVSYPMVEALKHICGFETFKDLKVDCKANIKYKNIVGYNGQKELRNYNKYDLETWKKLINAHLKKMNFIVNDLYVLPNSLIPQSIIFRNQYDKYIDLDSTVAVLSSFPIFIHDYYGNEVTLKLIE